MPSLQRQRGMQGAGVCSAFLTRI